MHQLTRLAPGDQEIRFLAGGGDMAARIAAFDWSTTPLGPLEDWPHSLRAVVALIVHSPVPMVLLWGEDGIMLYNDAYSVFAGGRHPALLGSKVREGWPEVAEFNDHVMKVGLAGGTLAYKDQELTLHRHGRPEQVWMNLDYSPVVDESGAAAGVIAIVVETTARVLAERRAASERAQLERMFAQAPNFMAMLSGPEHVFEIANPAYERLVGNRNVVGLTVAEAVPEAVGQGFFDILDGVYRGGEAYVASGAEILLAAEAGAAGELRVVDFVYQPLTGPDGRTTGIFVTGSDVTERARAETLLRVQNRLLQLAVTDAPLGELLEQLMRTVEAESRSGMLGSILLLSEDGGHLRHGAAPSLPDVYNEAIDGTAIGPSVGSCGTAAFRREPVYVTDIAADPLWDDFRDFALPHGLKACWSTPILSSGGDLLGTFAMYYREPRSPMPEDLELVRVVTRSAALVIERKQAEEERRRAETELGAVSRRLDSVLNNTRMAVFVTDDRQRCIFANAAAETLTGFSFAELQERPLHELVHHSRPDGSPYPSEECPIHAAFPADNRVQGEEQFIHRDGHFFPVAFTASPIHDEASKTVGTVIEARNIAEEKARAAELAEALHVKEVLLHEVNHRVKNSLQVVTSLLMLQAGQAADPDLKQALLDARGRIAVVASMHQRLYSTSEHDRVDFGEYLRELATETVRSLDGTGRISLEVDVQPDVILLLTQAVPLALVVSELVTNAVKYAFPDGASGSLKVSLIRAGATMKIGVADDGVGLPPADRHVTGLGTRIVTALVRQVRGTIETGNVSSGTAFIITVPLH